MKSIDTILKKISHNPRDLSKYFPKRLSLMDELNLYRLKAQVHHALQGQMNRVLAGENEVILLGDKERENIMELAAIENNLLKLIKIRGHWGEVLLN